MSAQRVFSTQSIQTRFSEEEKRSYISRRFQKWLIPTYSITVLYYVVRTYFVKQAQFYCLDHPYENCYYKNRSYFYILTANFVIYTAILALIVFTLGMIQNSLKYQIESQTELRKLMKVNSS